MCLTFGYLHPAELLEDLGTSSELMGWWDYYRTEPWGAQRDDGRTVFLAGLVGSLFGGKFQSNLALPGFIDEMYGPPRVNSEVMREIEKRCKHGSGIDNRD